MFFKDKHKERLARINLALKESFSKVRDDTKNLYDWVKYLNEENKKLRVQNTDQKKVIGRLYHQQKGFLKKEQVREIVKEESDSDVFLDRIKMIEDRIHRLESHIMTRKKVKSEPKIKMTHLQEKIVKNVSQKSKDYIKKTILSLLSKHGKIQGRLLREMVVDDQKLCSKSSFYRVLSELKKEEEVNIISSGKDQILTVNRKVFK
ncbi:hypothetical protein ACFLZN_01990 [Nanoarchaeota archaeon]